MKRALTVLAVLALLVALPATAVAARKHHAAIAASASITATVNDDGSVTADAQGGAWLHYTNDCVAGWVGIGTFTASPCAGHWFLEVTDSAGLALASTEVDVP